MHSTDEIQKKSTLILQNREELSLDGVRDVVSFDESALVLETVLGTLTVEGTGLHILALDLDGGRLTAKGSVSAVIYTDRREGGRGGFFSRMVH